MTSATSAVGYSHGILYTLEHDAVTSNNNKNNNNNNSATTNTNSKYKNNNNNNNKDEKDDAAADDNVENNNNNNNDDDDDNDNDADETDSFASMETLSDNVAIWVEGEQHWISGVDGNTTCADLIDALVNYQESEEQQQQQQQLCGINNSNGNDNKKSNNNCNNKNNQSINQSTLNTKENETTAATQQQKNQNSIEQQHSSCGPASTNTTTTSFPAHRMLTAPSSSPPPPPPPPIACTKKDHDVMYVIVKQHRHYEEFLDGNAKVFDVLPPPSAARDVPGNNRKERHHQLYLRRLTHTTQHINRNTPQLSSLLSTDKDSGMGSPVGSSRSAKFRRKKHKSYITNWLSQGNTLHPKSSQHGSAANERLLKIILAQDETIHRQLSLLREKERQISKIEEEKHRKRERELGKNYLLETYLNDLDEYNTADGLDMDEGEEIFIDDEYQGYTTTLPGTVTTTTTTNITANETTTKQKHRKQHKKHHHDKHSKTFNKNDNLIKKEKSLPANAAAAADNIITDVATAAAESNPKDIETQILWLEKIYAINKKLQNEEELLLKLHSKIRKYQVKRAYHTKQQLVQQMDEVDNNIALQYHDIRKVENSLVASNEQLKSKLVILEKLSQELLSDDNGGVVGDRHHNTEQQHNFSHIAITKAIVHNDLQQQQQIVGQKYVEVEEEATTMEQTSIANAKTTTTVIPAVAAAPVEISSTANTVAATKLTYNNMQSTTDLLSLQKLIAKPQAFHLPPTVTAPATAIASPLVPATTAAHKVSSTLSMASNFPISLINHPTKNSCVAELQMQQQQQQQIQQQQQQEQQQQQQLFDHQQQLNDKNSLALHVSHIKTIKKQMFGPKCLTIQELKPPLPIAAAATTTIPSLPASLDFTQLGTLV